VETGAIKTLLQLVRNAGTGGITHGYTRDTGFYKAGKKDLGEIMPASLVRVLNDGKLVHPVHQRVALFNNTFEFATYAGD